MNFRVASPVRFRDERQPFFCFPECVNEPDRKRRVGASQGIEPFRWSHPP